MKINKWHERRAPPLHATTVTGAYSNLDRAPQQFISCIDVALPPCYFPHEGLINAAILNCPVLSREKRLDKTDRTSRSALGPLRRCQLKYPIIHQCQYAYWQPWSSIYSSWHTFQFICHLFFNLQDGFKNDILGGVCTGCLLDRGSKILRTEHDRCGGCSISTRVRFETQRKSFRMVPYKIWP